jgi:SAM-dependent methyltransferase
MAKLCKRNDDALVLLHIGCGPKGTWLPEMFAGYEEWRMDIEAEVEPDMVGSITAIDLPDNEVDAVYASHILEHVEHWEVHQALFEVLRVLAPGGKALIVVPDLVRVAREITEHPSQIEAVNLESPFVNAPLDILYGWQPAIWAGQEFMRHRTAFTQQTLAAHLQVAGFAQGTVEAKDWQLFALAEKRL